MPTATYTPIASTTLSSTAASVTFSNLDTLAAGMRDLILVVDVKITGTQEMYVRLNGDSGSNYNAVFARGNGSAAASTSYSGQSEMSLHFNDSSVGSSTIILSLFDFSQTNKHKSLLWRHDNANAVTRMAAGRWASTSAVTTLLLTSFSGTWNAGSTFSLYGVIA